MKSEIPQVMAAGSENSPGEGRNVDTRRLSRPRQHADYDNRLPYSLRTSIRLLSVEQQVQPGFFGR